MSLFFRRFSLIVILFSLVIGASLPVFAGEKVTLHLGDPQLKETALILRKSLNKSIRQRKTAPGFVSTRVCEPYISNFDKKFIVLAEQKGGFGGLWVSIMINPSNMQFWRLWIYPIGKDDFEIRDISIISVTPKEKDEFKILATPKYQVYWN